MFASVLAGISFGSTGTLTHGVMSYSVSRLVHDFRVARCPAKALIPHAGCRIGSSTHLPCSGSTGGRDVRSSTWRLHAAAGSETTDADLKDARLTSRYVDPADAGDGDLRWAQRGVLGGGC
jgi:hypothetical protein